MEMFLKFVGVFVLIALLVLGIATLSAWFVMLIVNYLFTPAVLTAVFGVAIAYAMACLVSQSTLGHLVQEYVVQLKQVKEKTMKTKKLFDAFPEQMYAVHHDDDGGSEGYYLLFDDETEATEDAVEKDSQVASYEVASVEELRVVKTVERV